MYIINPLPEKLRRVNKQVDNIVVLRLGVATKLTQHVRAVSCSYNEKKVRLCVFITSCTGFFYQDKSAWSHLNNQC